MPTANQWSGLGGQRMAYDNTAAEKSTRKVRAGNEDRPRGANEQPILNRVTCPHCWHRFRVEEVLWVSRHSDLRGDPMLGPDELVRFLPTRFSVKGEALDARGMPCQQLACPQCHKTIPRLFIEVEPLILSTVGTPASGKSYFLAALIWELRRTLPKRFAIALTDVDAAMNTILNQYEQTLFIQPDPTVPVTIKKTEMQGDLYAPVWIKEHEVLLPNPFAFTLRPTAQHPDADERDRIGRILCLYDNAGEHFVPGADTSMAPGTQHLAHSRMLLYLYDPTQDPEFRQRCLPLSKDPQVTRSVRTERQELVLIEAANRVRQHANLPASRKIKKPLIVLITKADVWCNLIGLDLTSEPITSGDGGVDLVDVDRIEQVSSQLRQLLLDVVPGFVAAAEDSFTTVLYMPISALGRSPEKVDNVLMIRPRDIKPRWVTAPILYAFAKWSSGLLLAANSR